MLLQKKIGGYIEMKKINLSFLLIVSILLISGCNPKTKEQSTAKKIDLSENKNLIDEKQNTPATDKKQNVSKPKEKTEEKPASKPEKKEETENKKQSNYNETVLDESQKDTSNKVTFNEGSSIKIPAPINVYSTAADAKNRTNPVTQYQNGSYYIYKIYDGMLNISRTKDNPGGWMNPTVDFKIEQTQESSDSQPKQTPEVTSDEKYSWSWSSPGNAAASLEKFGGIYKSNSSNSIYLTFDNGYEYEGLTGKILDTLKNNNVTAAFFVTSDYLKQNPSFVKRMVNEGHIVGNHTARHLDHNQSSYDEIYNDLSTWEQDYVQLIGSKPQIKLFRPPEGKFNETSLKIAKSLGYKTVLWAYAYQDWDTSNQPAQSQALNSLLEHNASGNVLLLHAVSETNASILHDYIQKTKNQGYNFSLLK